LYLPSYLYMYTCRKVNPTGFQRPAIGTLSYIGTNC
jgi:hypothetical protein